MNLINGVARPLATVFLTPYEYALFSRSARCYFSRSASGHCTYKSLAHCIGFYAFAYVFIAYMQVLRK